MKINTPMYVVVFASAAGDYEPKYNRAYCAGVYTTLEEAKAKVKEIADGWKDDIGEDWKPGYCDDPDGSCKYADNYYDENCITAWHDGSANNWERVEIAYNGGERNTNHDFINV